MSAHDRVPHRSARVPPAGGAPIRAPLRSTCASIVLLFCVTGAVAWANDSGVVEQPRVAGGSLEGDVILGPTLPGRRMSFNLYPDLRRKTPPPAAARDDEMGNVVVYLEDVAGASAASPATYVMSQQDAAFVPHVLAVPAGSTVEFPNADSIYHNVFSLSRSQSFDPRGISRSVRFDEPGVVKVFCHIHSDMSGVVLVLPNRFFASPDAEGQLRIDGIPPGEYTVVAWHERAPRTSRTVRIAEGAATRVLFEIPLAEQADARR